MSNRSFVLTLSCREVSNVIGTIASFVSRFEGSVIEANYYSDPQTGWFFTRQAILAASLSIEFEEFRRYLAEATRDLGPRTTWTVYDSGEPRRVVLLASKEPHCVHDLLARTATGELPATIEAVISNHEDLAEMVQSHGVKFHHVPFSACSAESPAAFRQIRDLADGYEPDAVVLAKFMQVLPAALCDHWAGRAINIHHSFLPAFMGAKPYHQAFERGVKLIGATCHYATAELDAGPIIEQDVIRIDHSDKVADMRRQGRDIERVVLARGLRCHLEGRVLVRDGKTVVFD